MKFDKTKQPKTQMILLFPSNQQNSTDNKSNFVNLSFTYITCKTTSATFTERI